MAMSYQPYTPALLHRPTHEITSADVRADEDLGNYSHSQGLMSPASTPAPFLEQDPSLVGRSLRRRRSSEKLSTFIEKPNEPPHSLKRKLCSTYESPNIVRESLRGWEKKFYWRKPRNEQIQGLSEISKNAEDPGRPMPDPALTKIERIAYTEDLMQSIRSRVMNIWQAHQPPEMEISLSVPCNVRGFMEKQFQGSNKILGQVIVLSGTATHGQATTCSDYIHSNWPLRGPKLLNMLQDTFDRDGRSAAGNRPLSAHRRSQFFPKLTHSRS